jgi:branched-chain amino acid transport system permease protein
LLALFVSGAYPEFGFWTTSGEAIFMIMLGGSQLFAGPLIGAFLLQLLNRTVTIYTEHHGLVLGLVILAIVLGLRQGVGDFVMEWLGKRREARHQRAALSGVAAPAEAVPERGIA